MTDYQLLDAGDHQRLEQWGEYRLIRPDATASWPQQPLLEWQQADAIYTGSSVQDGTWNCPRNHLPERWPVQLGEYTFSVGLGSSKHVGLFPEQFSQWEELARIIRLHTSEYPAPIHFLNLFAYTGAASIIATKAGAFTTHVDSSAPAIGRAKINQQLNGLADNSIRWIKEDVLTFVQREVRRGHHYDIVALDPPAYGHGVKGEKFSLQKQLPLLLSEVRNLLSEKPLAIFVTTYSGEWQPAKLASICQSLFVDARVESKPLMLNITSTGDELTTGSWAVIQFLPDKR